MKFEEIKADLFAIDSRYYLVHCISSDFKLGKGIATEFRDRFNMVPKLHATGQFGVWPNCILIEKYFNLVTKEHYSGKPSYSSLRKSLEKMREIVIEKNIKHIAMPQIASNLDRLDWYKVRFIIEEIFKDIDVEIVVCIKKVRY